MNKIKILQFPIANSYGGITHYALDNWKRMDKTRFQCDFATMSKKLDFAGDILAMGSEIHYISCYAEENKEQFIKEFDEILDRGYDVVHLHTKQWKSFLVEELCRKKGIPKVIVHAHSAGIDTFDDAKREYELREHERVKKEFDESLATDFWACSEQAAQFLFGDKISKEKIKIMHNAVDLNKFRFNEDIRRRYREKYNLGNSFVIGNVARIVYQKNHFFLLDVFGEVLKSIPNAKLLLIGDGDLAKNVKKRAEQLGIDKNILFLGKRDDVNNWYQAMDILWLPSLFEGFPISLIEAQTSGLQCIISDRITKAVAVTPIVHCEELKVEKWLEQSLNLHKSLNRKSMDREMSIAGYGLKEQIKYLEEEYSRI